MAGLLHHNHGVLFVEHTVDADQAMLRPQHPWSAQRLTGARILHRLFRQVARRTVQRTLPLWQAAAGRAVGTPGLERGESAEQLANTILVMTSDSR